MKTFTIEILFKCLKCGPRAVEVVIEGPDEFDQDTHEIHNLRPLMEGYAKENLCASCRGKLTPIYQYRFLTVH